MVCSISQTLKPRCIVTVPGLGPLWVFDAVIGLGCQLNRRYPTAHINVPDGLVQKVILGQGIHASPVAEHVLAQVCARRAQHCEERFERNQVTE